MSLLRTILFRLAFANVVIALMGLGWSLNTLVLLGVPLDPVALGLSFATVFLVYTLDKTLDADLSADAENDPDRTAFLQRFRIPMLVIAILLGVGGGVVAVSRSLLALALFLFPVVTGLLYSFKIFPASWRYQRLKDITGVKSGVVGLSWGVTTVLLPLEYLGVPIGGLALGLVVFTTLRMFVNTSYFDLGDIKGDCNSGIVTLPVYLGHAATRRLQFGITAVGTLFLVALGLWKLGWIAHVVALGSTLYVGTFLYLAKDEDTDVGFLCDVVADSEGFVTGLIALAAMAVITG